MPLKRFPVLYSVLISSSLRNGVATLDVVRAPLIRRVNSNIHTESSAEAVGSRGPQTWACTQSLRKHAEETAAQPTPAHSRDVFK